MSNKFTARHRFNSTKARQYLNNEAIVLHCHHYITLITQLADDAKQLNGAKLLAESAEETFYPILIRYFTENNIVSLEDRTAVAEEYFSYIGLGKLKLNLLWQNDTAEMDYSHVDEGWIKKWSKRNKPVNFIGQGYIAAAFSAITGQELYAFDVNEIECIVSGAKKSKFIITKKQEVR